jgi:hypothetical protein
MPNSAEIARLVLSEGRLLEFSFIFEKWPDRYTRFTKKGLQSRSATASLLIKSKYFMEEKTKLVVF